MQKSIAKTPGIPQGHDLSLPSFNPAIAPWEGPFGGVPAFDRVRPEHLEPALEAGMKAQLAEIELITSNPEAPTFENTISAMERTGKLLNRATAFFNLYTSSMSTQEVQRIEEKMAPRLAAHSDAIIQHDVLFSRIAEVYELRDSLGLSSEQQRVLWVTYSGFVRSGAKLSPEAKVALSAINEKLASLTTAFSQNVLKSGESAIFITDPADLQGLSQSYIDAATDAARNLGKDSCWAILNSRSCVEGFLTDSTNRSLRQKVWEAFANRCDGGEHNNNLIIPEILRLRSERAQLLGYQTFAHLQLEDTLAKTPERAMALLETFWPRAIEQVRKEISELQEIADQITPGVTIAPWDYRFYQEKLRAEKYNVNQADITPYLQVEKLKDGMFHVATELFGLQFRELPPGTISVYHPHVRVWEVTDATKAHVGVFYFDPFRHEGKQSGAWMGEYREQEALDEPISPLIYNECNFTRAPTGEASLVSWKDAETLFHEFGHALHGLLSKVTYPSLAGTGVCGDFVELPSQLLENWLGTSEILGTFAVHYQTAKPMPQELVERIQRARRFGQGFSTTEYLASALVDLKLHVAPEIPTDVALFERETLQQLGLPKEITMRHRTAHFSHIFSGDAYAAAYYCYLWSNTLAADAWEAFTEAEGPWDKRVAARLRQYVLSSGNTMDPAEAYKRFRGREAGIEPLMRSKGFV